MLNRMIADVEQNFFSSPVDADTDVRRQVRTEQVKLLYEALPLSVVVSLFNAVVLTVVQWSVIESLVLIVWLSLMTLTLFLRGVSVISYRRRREGQNNVEYWEKIFILGLIPTAVLWGASSVFLFPPHNIPYQVFLAFVIAGMCAGAVTTLSAMIRMVLFFVIPALVPLIIQLFSLTSELRIAMSLMSFAFLVVIVSGAYRMHKNVMQNIKMRLETDIREQTVTKSRKNLMTIFNSVNDGIIILSLDGNVLDVNKKAQEMLGMTREELLKSHIAKNWSSSPEQAKLAPMFWQRAVNGEEFLVEWELRRPSDGVRLDVELFLRRLEFKQRPIILANIHDISEAKKVERLKSEFVSVVSHELRTPLTSIRGSLGLLAGGAVSAPLPDDVAKLVHIASSNTERLLNLVNDILDVEKIALGKLQFNMKKHQLLLLLKQSVAGNEDFASQYAVALELCTPLDDDFIVTVDRERFLQIMSNLISNAVKFSHQDGIVQINAEKIRNHVRVSVKDYGCGIPKSFSGDIFGKFSQVDSSDSRAVGGTGLGLNITKSLVEKMNGIIDFESQEGVGSTFYFDLPIA